MQSDLLKLCEFSSDQNWELLYRGTQHGFNAVDFHYYCDVVTNTLTVIKSENGNIFGGYTEMSWEGPNDTVHDTSKRY